MCFSAQILSWALHAREIRVFTLLMLVSANRSNSICKQEIKFMIPFECSSQICLPLTFSLFFSLFVSLCKSTLSSAIKPELAQVKESCHLVCHPSLCSHSHLSPKNPPASIAKDSLKEKFCQNVFCRKRQRRIDFLVWTFITLSDICYIS